MSWLTISEDKQHFIRDNEPFFWVGDTVWSAFTNASVEDWKEYLAFRKKQGFNVLQINTLPQWDRIGPDLGLHPYPIREDGSMDYTAEPNEAFINHTRTLCYMAVEAGFTLCLAVVWADIIPETWLTGAFPSHTWPLEYVEKHVRRVVDAYNEFHPVYMVCGDTNFDSPQAVAYVKRASELLKKLAPEALRTFHMIADADTVPEELLPYMDFCVYQSGHRGAEKLEALPTEMKKKYPGYPLLNAEPCYEAMPHLTENWDEPPIEFFSAQDVVEACRRSVAAGANAGITYGANGLWNWRRSNGPVVTQASKWYADPVTWKEAMHFPAAEQIAALKELSGI